MSLKSYFNNILGYFSENEKIDFINLYNTSGSYKNLWNLKFRSKNYEERFKNENF